MNPFLIPFALVGSFAFVQPARASVRLNPPVKPNFPTPLRGIVVPLITPLARGDAERIDARAVENLVGYVRKHGAAAVMVLGSTGEGPALSRRSKVDMINLALKTAGPDLPVLVNISDNSLEETLSLAAAAHGAAAVVLGLPSYFKSSPLVQMKLVRTVANAVPSPVFLYNIPSFANQSFAIETVRFALDLPNVVGIKDSSGDLDYLDQLLALAKARPDFSVLVGDEGVLAEGLRRGAHGGVSGSANVRPQMLTGLYDAVTAARGTGSARGGADVAYWKKKMNEITTAPNGAVAIFKHALARTGVIDCEYLVAPYAGLNDEEAARLDELLDDLGWTRASGPGR